MRKWLILLTALAFSMPFPAQAQGIVAMDSLTVLLWSEYDQPSMLVIYDFTVTDDTQVPTSMDLRFPSEANITAVAFQSGGDLLLANYQTQPSRTPIGRSSPCSSLNAQTIISNTTSRFNAMGNRDHSPTNGRAITPSATSISRFRCRMIVGVSKRIPPFPWYRTSLSISGGDMVGGLGQGQSYQLHLEYSRTDETPVTTPASTQVEPIAPVDENTDGRSTLDNLPLFLGGFGVALILAALFYFFRGQGHPNALGKTAQTFACSAGTQRGKVLSGVRHAGT
jgi:hypothetical protein